MSASPETGSGAGSSGADRVLAVGVERLVRAPDPIARDYLLLALRLDQLTPGLVDGYFGPAALKAQVDMEQGRSPARLREEAAALKERLPDEVADGARRDWLRVQLVALETQARALAGDPLPYLAHVARCFDLLPERTPEGVFEAAAADLDHLLPDGEGSTAILPDRIAAWDARFVVPPDRLAPILDWLVERFRRRAEGSFGLPQGESVRVGLVTKQPWSGYNWYDGGYRSRVDLNVDLPIRAADLLSVLPHESYPGHHLEHAWKEAELVERLGWLEHSVLLINAPECLLSEGLADLGRRFAVPVDEEVDLLVELYGRAGLAIAADPAAAHDAAGRQVRIREALAAVRGVRGNAALLLHADGAPREEAIAYLQRWSLQAPERAAKSIGFIEHPLWRTYVFVYFEGERLLRRWLEQVPPPQQAARFGRLLREPLTPTQVVAELA